MNSDLKSLWNPRYFQRLNLFVCTLVFLALLSLAGQAFASGLDIPAPMASPNHRLAFGHTLPKFSQLHLPHASSSQGVSSKHSMWVHLRSRFQLTSTYSQPAVIQWIHWFQQHRGAFNALVKNAQPYLYYIAKETEKRNMPAEFALLPMIESGFKPNAYSYAGAAGLWQMMPGTAASHGLRIDWWYDARRDVLASTKAALNYLLRLKQCEHSWVLAAAAYNVGPGALHALKQLHTTAGQSKSYWSMDALPSQTKAYVPKLMAIAAIINTPNRFGFRLPELPNHPFFAVLTLGSQMGIEDIATFSHLSVRTVRSLNPGLRRFATAPDRHYRLLLPITAMGRFLSSLEHKVGQKSVSWVYHEVRAKETLQTLAKLYHTRPETIARVNHLTGDVIKGQGMLVPIHLNKTYKPVIKISGLAEDSISQHTHQLLSHAMDEAVSSQAEDLPSGLTVQPIQATDSLSTILDKLYGR